MVLVTCGQHFVQLQAVHSYFLTSTPLFPASAQWENILRYIIQSTGSLCSYRLHVSSKARCISWNNGVSKVGSNLFCDLVDFVLHYCLLSLVILWSVLWLSLASLPVSVLPPYWKGRFGPDVFMHFFRWPYSLTFLIWWKYGSTVVYLFSCTCFFVCFSWHIQFYVQKNGCGISPQLYGLLIHYIWPFASKRPLLFV